MTHKIQNDSMVTFLDSLSAKTSTPGGGAVAAITGAQAAALISMVCQFSGDDPALNLIAEQAGSARATFLRLAEEDVTAFRLVMSAFKQPKDVSNRNDNIQAALIQAAQAPRMMLNLACSLVESTFELLKSGNKNLVTDTGIAAILIEATVDSAELNIMINLKSIDDKKYIQEVIAEIKMCKQQVKRLVKITDAIREFLKPDSHNS